MGVTIRQKPPGSGEYWLFIHHNGQRKSKKVGFNKKDAEQAAREIRKILATDPARIFKARSGRVQTFEKLADSWMQSVKRGNRESTAERYKQVLDTYIIPVIGKMTADKIDIDVCEELISSLSDKLSRASLEHIRNCISGPLEIALRRRHIQFNPTVNILKHLGLTRDKKAAKNKIKYMDKGQAQRFMRAVKKESPKLAPLFTFLLLTGCRLGEALAIEWSDIDLGRRTAVINKSYRRKLESTKTGKTRNVSIASPELIEILRNRMNEQRKQAGGSLPKLVFGRNGDHIPQNYVRRAYNRILKAAKLPAFRVHDLRHTFATLALKNGTPLERVSHQLGHSSIKITYDLYVHDDATDNHTCIESLSALIMHPIRTPENKKAVTR